MDRTKTLFRSGVLVGMLCALVVSVSPVGASVAPYAGWMVSRKAGVFSTYSPPPRDRWNSKGTNLQDQVERRSKGQYRVYLHGYAIADGLPLVTAIGKSKWCMVWTWGPDAGREFVEIYCYGANGQQVDSAFSLNYLDRSSLGNPVLGYAWNVDVSQNTTLSGQYTFNSAGGAIHSVRTSTGHTTVTFDGLGHAGGNVQVGNYLDQTVGACSASSWAQVGADEQVNIVCRETSGDPADLRYDLVYVRGTSLRGTRTGAGAYFLADQPTTGTYQPPAADRWSSSGKSPVIHRLSTGRYRVSLTGISGKGGSVQVTAVTSGTIRCNVGSIPTSGPTQQVGVRCSHLDGTPADSAFSFMFTR